MQLTAENVDTVIRDCLFRDGESTDKAVLVDGIVRKFGFHPERLASHKDDIFDMLKQLPNQFLQSGGGGWSFLNACNDVNGELWTGDQGTVEALMCLGIAIDKVALPLPRALWNALPGGVPYLQVRDLTHSDEVLAALAEIARG